MASYLQKEISEWNTNDLCNWLLANKFRGISELCQKYSLSGYDLFYINDDILKNELGLKSFHERNVALKLFNKLTYGHLRLNVINSNGDNVILTLDNNQETQLGEITNYIGSMFNINPKDILYKDSTKQEVLAPTVKIVKMLILYPKLYKTLNVSNMKDYHQNDEEMIQSDDYQEENNNRINMDKNKYKKEKEFFSGSMESDMMASGGTDFQNMDRNQKFNNNNYRRINMRENEQRNNLGPQNNNQYMNYKFNYQENINKNNKNNINRPRGNYTYEEQRNNTLRRADLAASFQKVAVEAIVNKAKKAIIEKNIKNVIIAGGVAANKKLRDSVKELTEELGVNFSVPPLKYCTDNGTMIAAAGYYAYLDGRIADLELNSKSQDKLC